MNCDEIRKEEELDIAEEPKEEEAYVRYQITSYPSDYTLEVLYTKWAREEIIIPGFQRKYVWDQDRASQLIESFLLGLPVPNVFFYVNEDSKSVVIDGQQRIKTICYFFEGYFGEPDEKGKRKIFKLSGFDDNNPYANKTYKDIENTQDGKKFRDAVLRAMNILQMSPTEDDTSIYHIFERLNTGGVSLKPQEVRNCVFRGGFNDRLFELNKNKAWRSILGKVNEDVHYKDVELILRIIALSSEYSTYESPMKEFLNKFMAKHQNPSGEWLNEVSGRFLRTAELINEKIGIKPFRPAGPLNTSWLDSVYSILMANIDSIPADLKVRYDSLSDTDIFAQYGTNSTRAIRDRFTAVKKILLG